MDRLVLGAALALCLALLVPLTYVFPKGPLPANPSQVDNQTNAGEDQDVPDATVRVVVDCKPVGPNAQELVASCSTQYLPEA